LDERCGITLIAVLALAWYVCFQVTHSKEQSPMAETKVVDWRVWKAATVSSVNAPSGSPVKAGDIVYVVSHLRDMSLGRLTFITPSPVALALEIAVRSAKSARETRSQITWGPAESPDGARWANADDLGKLYLYFEESMIAITFAFQALETFVNQVIVMSLEGTMKVLRRKEQVDWTAGEIERNCTTEEKLATILPSLGSIRSPKGTKLWEQFVDLKALRDGTMHLKELNQYARGSDDDTRTLYFQFLNRDPIEYPKHAMALIRHFTVPGRDAWLVAAEALLSS
jgi:hypothetical protein